MCRLFGVVGNEALQRTALQAFQRLGRAGCVPHGLKPGHLDGWGIVTYPAAGPHYIDRSGGSIEDECERYFSAVEQAVADNSRVVIAHVRKATKGALDATNAHPFCQGPWVLAHNGTVADIENAGAVLQDGATDSEALLSLWVAQNQSLAQYPEFLNRVAAQCRYSSLTTLVCDASHMLAIRKFSATPLIAMPGVDDPVAHLQQYYTLWHWTDGTQHVVCSQKLPEVGSAWTLLDEDAPLLLECA